jgi:hypothetical protein
MIRIGIPSVVWKEVSIREGKSNSTPGTYIDGEVEEVERARVGSVVVIVGTRSNG